MCCGVVVGGGVKGKKVERIGKKEGGGGGGTCSPFDMLRVNGGCCGMRVDGVRYIPFVLSLSKHEVHPPACLPVPFDKLRANGVVVKLRANGGCCGMRVDVTEQPVYPNHGL